MHFARNAPRYADLSSIQCIPTHKILNPPCKKPHTASRHVVKARPHLRATARTLRAAVQRGPKSRPNRDFIARPGGQPASCAPSISPRLARVRRARSTGHGVGTSPRRSLDGRTTTLDGLACTASDRDRTLDSSRRRAPTAAKLGLCARTEHAAPVARTSPAPRLGREAGLAVRYHGDPASRVLATAPAPRPSPGQTRDAVRGLAEPRSNVYEHPR